MNRILLILITVFILHGCEKNKNTDIQSVNIFVSIAPQKYFVERIGKERVTVNVMVMPGRNPAIYEPTPDQVISLAEADLFFTIGVPFENSFLSKIERNLDNLLFINISNDIVKRELFEHIHQEDPTETEKYNFPDPHTWLSPVLAKTLCKNIYDALISIDPDGEYFYRANYDSLITDLEYLHKEFTYMLSEHRGKSFLVFHPSFGYFADEYGLKQLAIETGGKEPGPFELEEIIEYANKNNLNTIFTQPEFSKRSAEVIAEAINGTVITLSTLDPDYINNLRIIAKEILKELEN